MADPVPAEDATDRWLRDLYRDTDKATVTETAAAEACAGLWGRALAAADVSPATPALAGVSPSFLAWAGRALILRGEAVAVIDVAEGGAMLLPCLASDVDGGADPAGWMYRVDIAGPSSHRSRRVPAAGVVHLRWAVRQAAPWRGLSPIREARATGRLHARATAMAAYLADPQFTGMTFKLRRLDETGLPHQTPDQWKENRADLGEYNARERPYRVPLMPPHIELDSATRDKTSDAEKDVIETSAAALMGACGIPPQLLSTSGEASVAREAWRLFYLSAVCPVARQVEGELKAKLHPEAALGFDLLRASDQDQISRATERRARAFKALTEAGIEAAEARRLAGLA